MMTEIYDPKQLEISVQGGIRYSGKPEVEVCGSGCPDRDDVTRELRGLGLSVEQARCLGGCATEELTVGSYVRVAQPQETSVNLTLAVVTLDSSIAERH